MAPQISVVVPVDGITSPQRLIGSLDLQSLPPTEFELVVVDRGLPGVQRESLRRVADRRPNVRLVGSDEDWIGEAREFVLPARPDQKLFPEALERLARFADQHGLDIVVGRAVQPRLPLATPFLADAPEIHDEPRAAALQSTVLLARRERIRPDDVGVETDGARVGVLASYPSSDDPVLSGARGSWAVGLDQPTADWEGSALVLSLSGSVTSEGFAEQAAVVARQIGSHLSFLLPVSAWSTTSAEDGTRWQAAVRFDPLTASAGGPLPSGTWEIDVVLSGPEGATAPATLRGGGASTALLRDVFVAVATSPTGTLQIDIGPSQLPVIGAADPQDASVRESARGSELQLRLPLHVHEATTVPGLLGLGNLLLPARIEVIDGEAWLTGFVSGLTGTQPLAAKFGRSPLAPLGVSLRISSTGEMTVVATPAPPPPAAPAPAPSVPASSGGPAPVASEPKPAAPGGQTEPKGAGQGGTAPKGQTKAQVGSGAKGTPEPSGAIARLRRAVPEPLEPLVKRLAAQPVAQQVYRRLTGLSR